MKSKFWHTVMNTFYSSLPLALIIAICIIIKPLTEPFDYVKIIVGYFCVILGQALFIVGLETSILPIGRIVGGSFAKYNNMFLYACKNVYAHDT